MLLLANGLPCSSCHGAALLPSVRSEYPSTVGAKAIEFIEFLRNFTCLRQ